MVMEIAARFFGDQAAVTKVMISNISGITGHSLRATLITSMSHAGMAETKVKAQGGWKSTEMVARYTRRKEDLNILNLHQFLKLVKRDWATQDAELHGEHFTDQFVEPSDSDGEADNSDPEVPSPRTTSTSSGTTAAPSGMTSRLSSFTSSSSTASLSSPSPELSVLKELGCYRSRMLDGFSVHITASPHTSTFCNNPPLECCEMLDRSPAACFREDLREVLQVRTTVNP